MRCFYLNGRFCSYSICQPCCVCFCIEWIPIPSLHTFSTYTFHHLSRSTLPFYIFIVRTKINLYFFLIFFYQPLLPAFTHTHTQFKPSIPHRLLCAHNRCVFRDLFVDHHPSPFVVHTTTTTTIKHKHDHPPTHDT